MSVIYKVRAAKQLPPSHPLHVSRFYGRERLHRKKMQDRQDLILYLAELHANAVLACARLSQPRGFCHVKLRLTTLREWVYDYRPALDYFFEVQALGYNFGEDANEISTLIPKHLEVDTVRVSETDGIHFLVPDRHDGVQSKVYIQQQNAPAIRRRLMDEGRYDLLPPTNWLLSQPEVNFVFARSGKLQQRDTSTWPVPAVETWPSWLRSALFGPGIDIEAAYTQYLLKTLREMYADRPRMVMVLYPDIVRSVEDKTAWREELASLLDVGTDDEGIAIVKRVCMSLANGSRISPAIMTNGSGFSVTADIIISRAADLSLQRLSTIGTRLQRVSSQYSSAKKALCGHLFRVSASRHNQKAVFASYFEWEREARYRIWEACDRHGIMVHDGIDGIPQEYIGRLPDIINQLGLRLTA